MAGVAVSVSKTHFCQILLINQMVRVNQNKHFDHQIFWSNSFVLAIIKKFIFY